MSDEKTRNAVLGMKTATRAAVVTPDDDTDLDFPARIMCGGSGDIAVITIGGDTVILPNVAAGIVFPLEVVRVKDTGTDAIDIVAIWD